MDYEFRNGIIRGDSYDDMIKKLKAVTGASKFNTERLVHTEMSYISNSSSLESYKDLGVKYYEYSAIMDSRTSEKCSGLDNKILEIEKAVIGVNYPPMHPFCRSRGIPISNRRAAQLIQDKAKEMDKTITPNVIRTIENFGGELEGLEFKIKSIESIKEKFAKGDYKIKDSLRFTSITSNKDMVDHYFNSIDELKKMGYNIIEVKNSWLQKSNAYKGVNINLSNDDFVFEIQFHPPESFDIKHNILHDLYEKYRRLDPNSLEAREIDKNMLILSKGLEKPPGIERIK